MYPVLRSHFRECVSVPFRLLSFQFLPCPSPASPRAFECAKDASTNILIRNFFYNLFCPLYTIYIYIQCRVVQSALLSGLIRYNSSFGTWGHWNKWKLPGAIGKLTKSTNEQFPRDLEFEEVPGSPVRCVLEIIENVHGTSQAILFLHNLVRAQNWLNKIQIASGKQSRGFKNSIGLNGFRLN